VLLFMEFYHLHFVELAFLRWREMAERWPR